MGTCEGSCWLVSMLEVEALIDTFKWMEALIDTIHPVSSRSEEDFSKGGNGELNRGCNM